MNIFKKIIIFFERNPLKKEFKKAKKIRKQKIKNMTEYEKILIYPTEYDHKSNKYLRKLSKKDNELFNLLKNIHDFNVKYAFFYNSKKLPELALRVGKNV
jgi:hypothetical protein